MYYWYDEGGIGKYFGFLEWFSGLKVEMLNYLKRKDDKSVLGLVWSVFFYGREGDFV